MNSDTIIFWARRKGIVSDNDKKSASATVFLKRAQDCVKLQAVVSVYIINTFIGHSSRLNRVKYRAKEW